MPISRLQTRSLPSLLVILLPLALAACGEPPVGAPCLPEQVPADGFNDNESYIEASSVQCQTRVCMVYKLRGNPDLANCETKDCAADDITCMQTRCAAESEIKKRVYCTCRCGAPAGFAECECPEGFSCREILEGAEDSVNGSYCVRSST